jgi:hypothetical protein
MTDGAKLQTLAIGAAGELLVQYKLLKQPAPAGQGVDGADAFSLALGLRRRCSPGRSGGGPLTAGTQEITHRIRRSSVRPPSPPPSSVPESDAEAAAACPVHITGIRDIGSAGPRHG